MKTLQSLLKEYTIFGPLDEEVRYVGGEPQDDTALEIPSEVPSELAPELGSGEVESEEFPEIDLSNPDVVLAKYLELLKKMRDRRGEDEAGNPLDSLLAAPVNPDASVEVEPACPCADAAPVAPQGDVAPVGAEEPALPPPDEDEIDFNVVPR